MHLALFYAPTLWHPLSGNGYQFWSGIAGATGIFAVFVIAYKRINCHEPWCWRIGRHHVEGTPYVTCHKHHPGLDGGKIKSGHIHAAHRKHHNKTKMQVLQTSKPTYTGDAVE